MANFHLAASVRHSVIQKSVFDFEVDNISYTDLIDKLEKYGRHIYPYLKLKVSVYRDNERISLFHFDRINFEDLGYILHAYRQ